jgi:apolipoprotein N-acyltransferase
MSRSSPPTARQQADYSNPRARAWVPRLAYPLACAAAGTATFLATATFDLWPLAWIGLVPALWSFRTVTPRRGFWLGWLLGFIANTGGFYWIAPLLQRFGHMPLVAALPIFVLLIAYQGLEFGIWGWLVARLSKRYPMTWVAPLTLVAVETCYWMIFPWFYAITQAWQPTVIQIAEIGGPAAVSGLLALANGAFYDLCATRPRPWRRCGLAGALVAASLVFGVVRIHQVDAARARAPKLRVGLVQSNFGILEGERIELAPLQLQTQREMSRDLELRGAQLIVWPESAYPYAFRRDQWWDFADARAIMRGFHTPSIIGSLTFGGGGLYPYNSALMMQPDGHITGRFDKNYLMLFGEYIPLYERIPWFQRLVPEASNLARGHDVTTFDVAGHKIAPLICYEDIIPAFARRAASLKPELFVNITNDAWFGRTSEPYEHLALAVFRTVEHRLDMVRSVNTGVSTFIDAAGRVTQQGPSIDPLELHGALPRTALLGDVALMAPTGFYGRVGDLLGWTSVALTAGLLVVAFRRRRQSNPSQC